MIDKCDVLHFRITLSLRLHKCFGGQDTQLLLWNLEMDGIVVPLTRPPGGSLTFSTRSQSSHWFLWCGVPLCSYNIIHYEVYSSKGCM